LYYILVRTSKPGGYVFWAIIISFFMPTFLLALSLFAYPGVYLTLRPVVIKANPTGDKACDFFNFGYVLSLYGFLLLHLSFLALLNYSISQVRAAFNEYRELKMGLYFTVANTFLSLGLTIGLGLQNFTAGKMFINMSQLLSGLVLIWFPLVPPVMG
jgi:hypothetical protein